MVAADKRFSSGDLGRLRLDDFSLLATHVIGVDEPPALLSPGMPVSSNVINISYFMSWPIGGEETAASISRGSIIILLIISEASRLIMSAYRTYLGRRISVQMRTAHTARHAQFSVPVLSSRNRHIPRCSDACGRIDLCAAVPARNTR